MHTANFFTRIRICRKALPTNDLRRFSLPRLYAFYAPDAYSPPFPGEKQNGRDNCIDAQAIQFISVHHGKILGIR
jgi:hypothetical protein